MTTLPTIGSTLAGKYRLDAEIGRGAFGAVFRATDTSVDRAVAVKVLLQDDGAYRPDVAARFKREARALATLKGPHTVRLFDFGTTDNGLMFAVFELLPGSDLATHLGEVGVMREPDVRHVTRQILLALREAHAAGLLHRDIKPANIHVFRYADDPLYTKLIDFGLARGVGPDALVVTRAGGVVGTARYMAPEQALGLDLSPASDLYSVGVVALEMLTGDERDILMRMRLDPNIAIPASGELQAILKRLISPNADDRYQDAGEVLQALEVDPQAAIETAVPPPPLVASEDATRPRHVDRPTERMRAPIVVAAAVATVVVGCLAYFAVTSKSAEDDGVTRMARVMRTSTSSSTDKGVHEPVAAIDAAHEHSDVMDADDTRSADGCGREVAPGTHVLTDASGPSSITWTRFVPQSYDPTDHHPLLIAFHGSQQPPRSLLDHAGLLRAMNERGVIVIAPHAQPPTWTFARDEDNNDAYEHLVNVTTQTLCIDRERIFVLGFDAGGSPAEKMSCLPFVSGVATTAFRLRNMADPCPDRAVPRLMFAPRDARQLPLTNSPRCFGLAGYSLEQYERFWLDRNQCSGKPRTFRVDGAECRRWSCEEPLVSCINDGGMMWKGMPQRQWANLSGCDGTAGEVDYADLVWKFFENPMKRP